MKWPNTGRRFELRFPIHAIEDEFKETYATVRTGDSRASSITFDKMRVIGTNNEKAAALVLGPKGVEVIERNGDMIISQRII